MKNTILLQFFMIGLFLCSCNAPVGSPPDNAESSDYYTYSILDDEIIITGLSVEWYNSTDPHKYSLVLPEKIWRRPVTAVNSFAFSGESGLTSIVIPDSVIIIGDCAFASCSNLTSVTLGKFVQTLGKTPFRDCEKLSSINVDRDNPAYCSEDEVLFSKDKTALLCYPAGKNDSDYTVPDSVITVADDAFLLCNNLTSLTLGNSVRTVGDEAFCECENMTTINFPGSLTAIGYRAFFKCGSLTAAELPDSVTTIGEEAFGGCANMKKLTLSNSLTALKDGAFMYCESLTSVIIPDSVTDIGEYVFSDCKNLTSVSLGKSLQTIGNAVFSDCGSLTSIFIPEKVINIGDYSFFNCISLTSIDVDADNPVLCSVAGVLCSKDKKVLLRYPAGKADADYNIPDTVSIIKNDAFQGCLNLTEVTFPHTVTDLGMCAFLDCQNLLSVFINTVVPPAIGLRTFHNNADNRTIYVLAESLDVYRTTDGWSEYADDIESQ
jgi:hypothetical protein